MPVILDSSLPRHIFTFKLLLPPTARFRLGGTSEMDVRPSRSRANSDSGSNASSNRSELVGRTSPGVRRMQIIAEELNNTDRVFIFISLFLVAYVYGLDGLLRSVYQVSRTQYLVSRRKSVKRLNSHMQRLDSQPTQHLQRSMSSAV